MGSKVLPFVLGLDPWYVLGSLALPPILIVTILLFPYMFLSSRPKNYPPGPPTIPVLGNLHLVPPSRSYVTYDFANSCDYTC